MKNFVLLMFIASILTACQSMYVPQAREVKKKPRSNGIIALPASYRPEDRAKADELMKQNCGTSIVNVVDEGETVVGQETKSTASNTNRDDTRRDEGNFLGMALTSGTASGADTQSSSVTKQIKEWQVSYDCISDKSTSKTKR